MVASASPQSFVFGGAEALFSPSNLHGRSATPPFKWGLRRHQHVILVSSRTKGQAFQILADPNGSSGKEALSKEAIMVDPLEAKRLAAKQMEEIKAKEKIKRRRRVEAINGAWAVIGLTAGLVVEGQTGKGILAQRCIVFKLRDSDQKAKFLTESG